MLAAATAAAAIVLRKRRDINAFGLTLAKSDALFAILILFAFHGAEAFVCDYLKTNHSADCARCACRGVFAPVPRWLLIESVRVACNDPHNRCAACL